MFTKIYGTLIVPSCSVISMTTSNTVVMFVRFFFLLKIVTEKNENVRKQIIPKQTNHK